MAAGTGKTIAIATLAAGTLDILSAFVWTGAVVPVLQSVASGPFGDAVAGGSWGAPLGLLVHFAIMAAMVTAYVLAAKRVPVLNRYWPVAGLLYGVALWIAMYWIVIPLRWPGAPARDAVAIAQQLISHCLLVGLPIAWITARRDRPGFH